MVRMVKITATRLPPTYHIYSLWSMDRWLFIPLTKFLCFQEENTLIILRGLFQSNFLQKTNKQKQFDCFRGNVHGNNVATICQNNSYELLSCNKAELNIYILFSFSLSLHITGLIVFFYGSFSPEEEFKGFMKIHSSLDLLNSFLSLSLFFIGLVKQVSVSNFFTPEKGI